MKPPAAPLGEALKTLPSRGGKLRARPFQRQLLTESETTFRLFHWTEAVDGELFEGKGAISTHTDPLFDVGGSDRGDPEGAHSWPFTTWRRCVPASFAATQ